MSVTPDQVKAYLGVTTLTAADTAHLSVVADAVNVYVTALNAGSAEFPADMQLGAIMLAGRLYTRRNSPNGVATFTDMGASYVARYDPDVERLLRIGKYAPGVVA